MVLIKRITAGVTAFALAAVMQGASLTAFSEGDVSAVDSITKAAIVTEVSTGQVLYEHNSHERLPMASVTKLMCLLIWAEEMEKGTFGMDTVITATARANAMVGIRYDTLGRYCLCKRCLCGGMRIYNGNGRNVRGANEQKGAGAWNERYSL